jgi:hypothetical protein
MITVIDAMCGKGKSSYAIQMMNVEPERSYIYVTPLLSEVQRIKEETNMPFCEPKFVDGRKLHGFNELLRSKSNIAVSHSTFANSTDETIELLKEGNYYTLILDEVLDVVEEFKRVADSKDKTVDIKLLKNKKLIEIDEQNRVKWIGESYDKGAFSEVERMAKRGNLLLINDKLFLWEFPIDVFKSFDEVLILTYMFDGSFLKYYLQYNELEYELRSVEQTENTEVREYRLCDYQDDKSERHMYRDKIVMLGTDKMNDYPRTQLCSTWSKNNLTKDSEETETLRKNLRNALRNLVNTPKEKATAGDMMWTCFEVYHDLLKGAGYTMSRILTAEDKTLPKEELKKLKKSLLCFVPCNARASNDYRNRFVLAYLCNMYPHTFIVQFFEKKKGIIVDKDAYALSCLIQWVWRSRIRDGENIRLYLPSTRMRTLFEDWLDGK